MTTIRFVLESIEANTDPIPYLTSKVRAQWKQAAAQGGVGWDEASTGGQLEAAAQTVWDHRSGSIPIALPDDFPALSPAEEKLIAVKKACAAAEVQEFSPLLDGEMLQEDAFSYLTADYGSIPKNTAVLRRTTSAAVFVYFITHAQIQGTSVEMAYPGPQHEPVSFAQAGVLASTGDADWDSLIKFGEGLVWLLPEPFNIIGAAILPVIFPANKTNWQEIFKNLAEMIKQDIIHLNIEDLDGKIKGVLIDISSNYRGIAKPVNEKQAQLDDYISRVTEVIGTLQEKDYKQPGLAVFISAACLHLSLLEEKAMLENHAAPQNSQYSGKVKEQAQNYIDYAIDPDNGPYPLVKSDLNQQKSDHLGSISQPKSHTDSYCHGGAAASCTSLTYWYFEDTHAKYKSGTYSDYSKGKNDFHSGKSDCQPVRDRYYQSIAASYDGKLNHIEKLMTPVNNSWRKLAAGGIPPKP